MIDHLSTYATDFPATRAFYEAALARLGYSVQFEMTLDADPDLPGRRACAFALHHLLQWGEEARNPYGKADSRTS